MKPIYIDINKVEERVLNLVKFLQKRELLNKKQMNHQDKIEPPNSLGVNNGVSL